MKFQVMFKSPDALQDAIMDIVGVDDDLAEELETFAEKWVKYNEYITVEFDTKADTAVVVKV